MATQLAIFYPHRTEWLTAVFYAVLLLEGRCFMIYYRMALQGRQSAMWRWKSSSFTSLDGVLGWLRLYRCVPREHVRVFLTTSLGHMEEMLRRTNHGLLSTAITIDRLWDRNSVNWIEVRRLEVELGTESDHDQPYTWNLPPSGSQAIACMKLRTLREQGVLKWSSSSLGWTLSRWTVCR